MQSPAWQALDDIRASKSKPTDTHTILLSNIGAADFLASQDCARRSVEIPATICYGELTKGVRIARLLKNTSHDGRQEIDRKEERLSRRQGVLDARKSESSAGTGR